MDNGGGSSRNGQYTSVNTAREGKRICHRHTTQQTQRLEAYFRDCPHPDESQRHALCVELKLEPDQVKFWFQNKRTQSKVQDERSENILLRGDIQKLFCENEALSEALRNVFCPDCGGPSFNFEERQRNLKKMRMENAYFKQRLDEISDSMSKNQPNQQLVVDSFPYVHKQQVSETCNSSYETKPNNLFEPLSSLRPPTSQTIQTQVLSQMDPMQLSQTAANAVEELKQLFLTEDTFWIKSCVDGTYVIDQERYENLLQAVKHFNSMSVRVESSKDVTVLPIEALTLIEMFLNSGKWKELFPTIVNKVETIHVLGSELPINENRNLVQVIREKLHIVSPLVAPREFMIVRCCQQIDEGLWIVADVSHGIVNFDQVNTSCFKRPSGCLIRSLPNAHSQVTWIEHVEVDDRSDTHQMYKAALGGGSGYGAKRWIATLERMCERMALTSSLIIPDAEWSEVITTVEGRKNAMKLGERIVRNFNEILTMSGKVEFPQQSNSGVRVSVRMNNVAGQPCGLVISAASCLSIPLPPLQVFSRLQNVGTRQQWDILCHENVVFEIARVSTGSNEINCVTILRPTQADDIGIFMEQECDNKKMVMIQDCYMDALGGMIVYAPLDVTTMKLVVSGEVDHSDIQILPSGLTISSDGHDGGTLLTVVMQILVSGKTDSKRAMNEKSVDGVSNLISSVVQNIRVLLNCPDQVK